jgi:hypothetical protein
MSELEKVPFDPTMMWKLSVRHPSNKYLYYKKTGTKLLNGN